MTTLIWIAIITVAVIFGFCLGALIQARATQDELNDKMNGNS